MIYKHRNILQCFKKQILWIYSVRLLDKCNKYIYIRLFTISIYTTIFSYVFRPYVGNYQAETLLKGVHMAFTVSS